MVHIALLRVWNPDEEAQDQTFPSAILLTATLGKLI